MYKDIAQGVLLPFVLTGAGAACVFFLKRGINETLSRVLCGFAAGIMTAASFFSLILPAVEQSKDMGSLAFLPATAGFALGVLFLLALDAVVRKTHLESGDAVGMKRTTKLLLAVTVHNVPEGLAVGIIYAGWMYGDGVALSAAFALALGIGLQNFPEGAIVSMPLCADGMKKGRAFMLGALSGAVEPVAAVAAILAAGVFVPLMPYLLSFAAGAMFYVVVGELVPEMSQGGRACAGMLAFTLGFVLMTALDVALG